MTHSDLRIQVESRPYSNYVRPVLMNMAIRFRKHIRPVLSGSVP